MTVLTLLTILDNFDNDTDNPRDVWPLSKSKFETILTIENLNS